MNKIKETIIQIFSDKELLKAVKLALSPKSNSSVKPKNEINSKLKAKDSKVKQMDTKGKQGIVKKPEPIPNLDKGQFLDTFVFVLCSIIMSDVFTKEYFSECLQQVYKLYIHLIRHHGITEGTKKWKERAQYTILLAEGRKPEPLPWVATEGTPPVIVDLISLRKLIEFVLARGNNWEKGYQALITIISLPRISRELPELNLTSIEAPFSGDPKKYKDLLKDFKDFVRNQRSLTVENDPVDLGVVPRMRMTQGPNGEPTLTTSIEEAGAIFRNETLRKSIELYATLTGNSDFYSYMASIASLSTETEKHGYIGRIAQVPDSLNKNRVVAMVDYWTNILLSPLEEKIRYLLKTNFHKTDFLRDHSEGAERVRKSTRKSWSLDLSSWTDRFPIDLQQIVVEKILGKNLGQHWKTILTSRGYWVPKLNRFVSYSVGQPMGSKSSFAVASVTHHMLLHYAYSLLNKEEKEGLPIWEAYCIVGDDLVIFNESLTNIVKDLYRILGVEVSLPKSKIPVGDILFTEFCSRTSINNIDVSRIPPNLIKDSAKNWRSFPLLLKEMVRRNVRPNMSLLPAHLGKVDKEGVSYLANLKVVLTLPILGTDLSDLAKEINCKVDIHSPALMREVVYTKHILMALDKIDEANDSFSNKFQFGTTEWETLNSVRDHLSTENIKDRKSFSWCIYNQEGPLFRLATESIFDIPTSKFHLKLKERKIPHPASLASTVYAYQCSVGIFKGLPNLKVEPNTTKDMTVMSWLKEIGKQVAAVLPKEAHTLVPTVGNQGTEFVRTQILHYLEIHKYLCKQKRKFDLDPYPLHNGIKLNLNTEIKEVGITDLIEEWGETPTHKRMAFTYLIDTDPLFTQVVTTTKAAGRAKSNT